MNDRLESKMANISLSKKKTSTDRIRIRLRLLLSLRSLVLIDRVTRDIVYIFSADRLCWHERPAEHRRSINVCGAPQRLEEKIRNNNNQSSSFMITSSHHSLHPHSSNQLQQPEAVCPNAIWLQPYIHIVTFSLSVALSRIIFLSLSLLLRSSTVQ